MAAQIRREIVTQARISRNVFPQAGLHNVEELKRERERADLAQVIRLHSPILLISRSLLIKCISKDTQMTGARRSVM